MIHSMHIHSPNPELEASLTYGDTAENNAVPGVGKGWLKEVSRGKITCHRDARALILRGLLR